MHQMHSAENRVDRSLSASSPCASLHPHQFRSGYDRQGISHESRLSAAAWGPCSSLLIKLLADSAPQLRHLEFCYPCHAPPCPASALPAELGRLSQLTSLSVDVGSVTVTAAQVNAVVAGLSLLKHFTLRGVWYHLLPNGFPLGIVHSCGQLQELVISGASLFDVPSELGRLTALTRLELSGAGVTSLPLSISQLTALRELDLQENAALALPPGLIACKHLTRLAMGLDTSSPVLASLPSLAHLRVESQSSPEAGKPYFTCLLGLRSLHLICRGSIPAGLSGMKALRELKIHSAAVTSLPAGLYLRRLESLYLKHSTAHLGIPSHLAAAMQLQHLSLETSGAINLSAADVVVLSAMPALKHLSLKQGAVVGQRYWDACFTSLRANCTAQGRTPPTVSE